MKPILSKAIHALVLLALAALPFNVLAEDELRGEIRFRVADGDAPWVGQQRELLLELWTTGFSFAGQSFTLPEVRGAYLLQPDSSTVNLSETRDGVRWQGLRYSFLLFPQREGTLRVPSFGVAFTARAGYGSEPAEFRYDTGPLTIEARWPPGADPGGLLVTSSSFEMDSSWAPAPSGGAIELKTGDALTLTVTRSARDVPGMVFSPLPEFDIDGLAVYPATPQVDDRINRGSLTGRRVDEVTFVCEREGSYRIPGMRFQWWDPESERLAEERIDALELAVIANPAMPGAAGGRAAAERLSLDWKTAWFAMAGVLVLVLAWRYGLPATREFMAQRRRLAQAGEPWAFRQVRKACQSGNPVAAYNAITLWLGRVDSLPRGITLMEWAKRSGNDLLKEEATTLQERVASGLSEDWEGGELARLIAQSREGLDQSLEASHVLRALNPP